MAGYNEIIDGLLYLGPECHAKTCMQEHPQVRRIVRCKREGYECRTYLNLEPVVARAEGEENEEDKVEVEYRQDVLVEKGAVRSEQQQSAGAGGKGKEESATKQDQRDATDETNKLTRRQEMLQDMNKPLTPKPTFMSWAPQVLHIPMTEGSRREDVLEIAPYLPHVWRFIDEAEKAGEAVYVHCAVGVNRSATITTSYVMHRNKWWFSKALEYVQSKRRVVNPDIQYRKQLEELEEQMFSEKETLTEREERKRLAKNDDKAFAVTQVRSVCPHRSDEEIRSALEKVGWDANTAAGMLL